MNNSISEPTLIIEKWDRGRPVLCQAIESDNNSIEVDGNLYSPKSIVTIDGVDYGVSYINAGIKGNKGGNSFVFKAIPVQGGNEYAIKISRFADSCKNGKMIECNQNGCFRREVEALNKCKEQNLPYVVEIKYNGYIVLKSLDNNSTRWHPFYLMEFAPHDMKSYFESKFDSNTGFDELDFENKIDLCIQIARGIDSLHNMGYYHRDIKPDNILFFDDDNSWKIGDLGLIASRDQDYNNEREWVGPRGWMSPESMNKYLSEGLGRDKRIDCIIDESSDVFQLGKVFWYIMQGNAPIGCVKRSDFFNQSDDLYSVIRNMINHAKSPRRSLCDIIKDLERIQKKLNA